MADFNSRDSVQWTRRVLSLSIKNSARAIHLSLNPRPARRLRTLTFGVLKGPIQRESQGQGVREALTGKGNAIPHPPHLPKALLAIRRRHLPEHCRALIQALGGIKIAGRMLQTASMDSEDMCSQQLALKVLLLQLSQQSLTIPQSRT